MMYTVLLAQFLFSSTGTDLDLATLQALEKRGLLTADHDFRGVDHDFRGVDQDLTVGIDTAFLTADTELFLAISKSLCRGDYSDQYGDQVIRLYAAHPDDEFKKAIFPSVVKSMSHVGRIARSKYGCVFITFIVENLFDPKPNELRGTADICLSSLSQCCEFSSSPYLVKALLLLPHEDHFYSGVLSRRLLEDPTFVTPEMAFHIYQKYKNGYGWEKDILPYKEKAQPYLSGSIPVSSTSLDSVMKSLDAMIEKIGKDLCEKYKDVEPAPRPIPPPPPPGQEMLP